MSRLFAALGYLALFTAATTATVPKGKAVFFVGNSFHWWLPEPIAALAKEAGIEGHKTVGNDRIGGSEPCQHWDRGGEGNVVKRALKSGTVDYLTLTPREKAPDPCIPKFIDLGISVRKDLKIFLQETWIVQSAHPDIELCEAWGCKARDKATYEMVQETRVKLEQPYKSRLINQISEINTKLGTNATMLVPVYDAILTLRQLAVKGQLPGVPKQSSLFIDNLGHPKKAVKDLASYMWFAAMYGINPQGMKALASGSPPEQTALLQKLAWDTLKREPLNNLV